MSPSASSTSPTSTIGGVDVFAGAANADGLLQGPLREAGIARNAWSMCSFPDGQSFVAADGVIMTFTKDGIVRFLAGTSGRSGYQDGPASSCAFKLTEAPRMA